MDDYDLYGKYYNRADRYILQELIVDIIIAGVIWFFTYSLFYAFIYIGYAFIKLRQNNSKNRQLEILNRLDKIEEKINKD